MADAEVVLSPGEAARRLGVSPSGLRRLAAVYGEVHGELEKDSSGTSRVWPQEAVMRLEAARALMAAGQARSIKDALRAVERGAQPAVEAALALSQEGRIAEALRVVAARLEALQASNERLEVEVAELRAELGRQTGPAAIPRVSSVQPSAFGDRPAEEAKPEAYGSAQAEDDPDRGDGLLTRAARALERILRGRRG